MTTYYLDTSIWLDYYEKRGRNGILAESLLVKLIEDDLIIGISDLTLKELKNLGYSKSEISEILSLATPKNSRRIHINVRQIQEAVRISNVRKVPRKDALHAILCRDNDFILIARDRHFELLKEITEAKKPEEVI